MQDYIDAQSGGPGQGLLPDRREPVRGAQGDQPGQARGGPGDGGLRAVRLRAAVRRPARATEADIDGWLDRLHELGVRQLEITNKFDNALTGVAGDNGTTGDDHQQRQLLYDRPLLGPRALRRRPRTTTTRRPRSTIHNDDAMIANGFDAFLPPGAAAGLSRAAATATRSASRRSASTRSARSSSEEMIFDPDHMSVLGRDAGAQPGRVQGLLGDHLLAQLEHAERAAADLRARRRGHALRRRVRRLRPRVAAPARLLPPGAPVLRRRLRRRHERLRRPGPAARRRRSRPRSSYPFRSLRRLDDARPRQRSGERVYDINADGIAHYGLYPDWIEDLRMVGGRPDRPRHGPRRRGLPADVGARRGDPGGALRPLAPALPDRARARAPARSSATGPKRVLERAGQPVEPDPHLALVRERPQARQAEAKKVGQQEGRRRLRPARPRRADRQHPAQAPRRRHPAAACRRAMLRGRARIDRTAASGPASAGAGRRFVYGVARRPRAASSPWSRPGVALREYLRRSRPALSAARRSCLLGVSHRSRDPSGFGRRE